RSPRHGRAGPGQLALRRGRDRDRRPERLGVRGGRRRRHREADARRRRGDRRARPRPRGARRGRALRPRRHGAEADRAVRIAMTSDTALYLRLLTYVRPYAKIFGVAIITMILGAMTEPLFPAYIKPLLDHGFTPSGKSSYPPALFAGALVGIFLLR